MGSVVFARFFECGILVVFCVLLLFFSFVVSVYGFFWCVFLGVFSVLVFSLLIVGAFFCLLIL